MLKRGVAVLFVLAVLGALGGYLARDWLAERAWEAVHKAAAEQGVFFSYDGLDYTLRRGLVLQNLTVYRDASQVAPLARLSDLGVRISSPGSAGGGTRALLSLQHADLILHTGTEEHKVAAMHGKLAIGVSGMEFSHLKGKANGLTFVVSGPLNWSSGTTKNLQEGQEADQEQAKEKVDLATLDLAFLDEIFRWIDFESDRSPVVLKLRLSKKSGSLPILQIEGTLKGKKFSWRDVPLDALLVSFSGGFGGADPQLSPALTLTDLSLTYEKNSLKLESLDFPPDFSSMVITGLDSEMDAFSLVSRLVPSAADSLGLLSFPRPPRVQGDGRIDFLHLDDSDASISLSAPQGMTIQAGDSPLILDSFAGDFEIKEGTIASENFVIGVFGGEIDGTVEVSPFADPLTHASDLSITGIPMGSLMQFAGADTQPSGKLDLRFKGSGTADLATLNGAGRLDGKDVEFVSVPILGQLAKLLGKLVNGFSYKAPGDVTADFQITDGVLKVPNFNYNGSALVLDSEGTVDLGKGYVDTIKASAQTSGFTGIATGLVGKALEVEISGPFEKTSWKFTNLPALAHITDLAKLESAAHLLAGTAEVVAETAGAVVGKTGEVLSGAGEMTGAVVKGVGAGTLKAAEKAAEALKKIPGLKGFREKAE